MFELIKSLLNDVWEFIKKIIVKIVSFLKNILSFFKNPNRLRKLQEDQNRIAVAIKEKLDNGDYQVVNCLYDKQDCKLVTPEDDAEVITSEDLDVDTRKTFGTKDMIVLQ